MKTFIKSLLTCAALISTTYAMAQDNPTLNKYNNAKIAINYSGNLGYFSQLLAYKLNIAYYAHQATPAEKISVQQNNGETLQALLDKVNQQLKQQHLILTTLNEKPTLALVNKQTDALDTPQFIGDIIFADGNSPTTQNSSQKPIIVVEPLSSKGEKKLPK